MLSLLDCGTFHILR